MDTKIASSILGIAAVLGIGYFILNHQQAPAGPSTSENIATSTSPSVPFGADKKTEAGTSQTALPMKASSQPTFSVGAPVLNAKHDIAMFDASPLTVQSANPTITGSANVPKVGIAIYDSTGTGLVGTSDIPVVKGTWSYTSPVSLPPGTYSVVLVGGDKNTTTTMTVSAR